MSEIAGNLSRVRERIGEAALRVGRGAGEVRLVAVSKTFPIQALREAYEAGQRDFGENKVQEALQKMEAGADMHIGWHLIGHLQSNKARKAAARADWIHAIDSMDLLRRVDEAASALAGWWTSWSRWIWPSSRPSTARPWIRCRPFSRPRQD